MTQDIQACVAGLLTLSLVAGLACSSDDDTSGGTGGTGGEGGTGGSGGAVGGENGGPDTGGDELGGGVCDADQMCDFTCEAGCTVECLSAQCTADCDDGDCVLDADLEAVVTYSCGGGGCAVDCDNGSECSVNCPGGGCDVSCDGDARCSVSCSETGDPCNVSCASGATANCDTENCVLSGCEACDPTPDPTYTPEIDPANFADVVDNALFPLPVGAMWVYEAPDEVITVTVTDEEKTVMGVDVVVVHDQATTPDGEIIEDTFDWYAQDSDGNVWYFGEETAEYVNGMVANTRGSWEAGVNGALPGIIMHASHTPADIGVDYRQEYYPCEAEDMGEVVAVNESVTTDLDTYTNCIRIRDFTPLEPNANEHKTYCPGVGLVLVTDPESGEALETLTSVTTPQ